MQMAEVDPETLLEWLLTGQGDERDMQLIALEQLCMLLLMSDNVDRCFERFVYSWSSHIYFLIISRKSRLVVSDTNKIFECYKLEKAMLRYSLFKI